MSKRLILVLALAFVVGIAFAAYAEVQNVKVSGDLTVYGIMRALDIEKGDQEAEDMDQSMASIVRVRVDADLTDNVIATVRLLNERYWGEESEGTTAANDANTNVVIDLAYATMKEFLYSPLTLAIGRQELHFGNDMIVGDPDTNNQAVTSSVLGGTANDPDLSARKAFDAIRATLNYDPLVVDIVASKIDENTSYLNDDVSLYGVNANYALNKDTTIEGYYWLKHQGDKYAAAAPKGQRVDVVGARVVTSPIANLIYQLEAAFQFGKRSAVATDVRTVERRAWALETSLTYNMPKVKYTPSVTALYNYFSGEAHDQVTGSSRYSGWDPMYENQSAGDIANALFDQTNAHILGVIGTAKLTEDVSLKGEYYAYWWAKAYPNTANHTITDRRANTVHTTDQRFAAQEIDLKAIYDYTEDVQFCLLTGILIPGPAFTHESRRTASEVIGSMKVTF